MVDLNRASETTLQTLRRLDPSHEYSMHYVTGVITVCVDGEDIDDPFDSPFGPCIPGYYGIPTSAALVMTRHNMELKYP